MTQSRKEPLSVHGLTVGVTLMLVTIATMVVFVGCRAAYGQVQTDSDRYECQYYHNYDNPSTAEEDLLVFSDDESMVAIVLKHEIIGTGGSAGWRVIVLDVPTCQVIQTIPAKADADIMSISFSPDNKDIAVLINDGRILVYDARTGEENRDWQIRYRSVTDKPSHRWIARDVQFSHDGAELFLHAKSNAHDISIITFPLSDWKNGWTEAKYNDSGQYTHMHHWSFSKVRFSPDRKYYSGRILRGFHSSYQCSSWIP